MNDSIFKIFKFSFNLKKVVEKKPLFSCIANFRYNEEVGFSCFSLFFSSYSLLSFHTYFSLFLYVSLFVCLSVCLSVWLTLSVSHSFFYLCLSKLVCLFLPTFSLVSILFFLFSHFCHSQFDNLSFFVLYSSFSISLHHKEWMWQQVNNPIQNVLNCKRKHHKCYNYWQN